jgi:Ca2+-binding RTX toxin-like protein
MATVQIGSGFFLQMDAIDQRYVLSSVTYTDSSTFEITSNIEPFTLDLQGSFTYNTDGTLHSGVVTGAIEYYQGTIADLAISGLPGIDAVTLLTALATDSHFVDIWRGILGGGDVIEGGNGGPNHLYGFGAGGDEIFGGHSDDVLIGQGGGNTIFGAGNHDWINGGPGVNVLIGGAHATTFAFFAIDNRFSDAITNFKPGTPASHDVIELHSLPGLHNFNQVMSHAAVNAHYRDVVIHDNIGDHIILSSIHSKAQLHAYDFHFLA